MAVTGQPANRNTPKKKPAARKVAAPARTAGKTADRTAALPAAAVEGDATAAAAAALPAAAVPRPSRARAAAKAAAAMRGESTPAAEPAAAVPAAEADPSDTTTEVTFKRRKVLVRLPTSEQLTMYRRLSREFQDLARDGAADEMALDDALKQLDRAVRLVQSILVDDNDREWLENQILDGKVNMAECSGLLRDAFVLLNKKHEEQASPNRAARRSRARLAED